MPELQTNWKHEDEDGILLKIISFPCDYGDFGGESMWVRVIEGTDNDGIGYVCNDPAFSSLRYGDVITLGRTLLLFGSREEIARPM